MKLETIEESYGKKSEIKDLQHELAGAINSKRRDAEGAVDRVGEKVGEAKDKVLDGTERVKKSGWWPW